MMMMEVHLHPTVIAIPQTMLHAGSGSWKAQSNPVVVSFILGTVLKKPCKVTKSAALLSCSLWVWGGNG